jgi:hypothetical protein
MLRLSFYYSIDLFGRFFKYPQIGVTTSSNIHVDEIIHIDNFNQIYFTGSEQNNTLERQVYRWNYRIPELDIECISCQDKNDSCGYAYAQFSRRNGSYYILECYGPSIPYSMLYKQTEKLGKSFFKFF